VDKSGVSPANKSPFQGAKNSSKKIPAARTPLPAPQKPSQTRYKECRHPISALRTTAIWSLWLIAKSLYIEGRVFDTLWRKTGSRFFQVPRRRSDPENTRWQPLYKEPTMTGRTRTNGSRAKE